MPSRADVVDLRSDTVTQPTPAMRRAMAEAEVGDDDYGEDPTVRALEEAFAARVGKPAALFVPSGVMANQIAVRVLTRPGTAVVAGRRQHVVAYEYGAAAMNAGIQFIELDDDDGMLRADDVRGPARRRRTTSPPSRWSASRTRTWRRRVRRGPTDRLRAARRGGRPRARSTWTGPGCSTPRWPPACRRPSGPRPATTVMCCLSKGLCAPVGSLLAGASRRDRRGRAWRASGSAAACARPACSPHPGWWRWPRWSSGCPRTTHGRRAWPRRWPQRWPGCGLDPAPVRTNIVTFTHPEPDKLLAHLEGHGVLAHAIAPETVRFVTHHDVDDAGIDRARRGARLTRPEATA